MSFTQNKEPSSFWQLRVVCFLIGLSIALGAKVATPGQVKLQLAKLSKIEATSSSKTR